MQRPRTAILVKMGKNLNIYTQTSKSKNVYEIKKDVYRNESCEGCPYRDKCHKSKNDYQTIKVSRRFVEKRENSQENILSDKDILLRINRIIQVEGAFGVIKEDLRISEIFNNREEKMETQFFQISFVFNIQKYFNILAAN